MANTKGFDVYRNDQFIKFIPGRSLAACKRFIKDGEVMIGTHMGQWVRTITVCPERPFKNKKPVYEYEYCTTIGVYIRFRPAFI